MRRRRTLHGDRGEAILRFGQGSKGRGVGPEDLDRWRTAVGDFVDLRDAVVLDLGAGTGIFTRAWCAWGADRVVACESPASRLRQCDEKQSVPAGPHASLLAGRAELILLASAIIDIVWLSTVIHHITDRLAWAEETRRILRPGGWLLIRNEFADLGTTPWLEVLPGAERARQIFPSVSHVAGILAPQGFEFIGSLEVAKSSRDDSPPTVADWIRRMRHADSLLLAFTDDEIHVGLDRLDGYKPVHRLGPLQVGLVAFRLAGD